MPLPAPAAPGTALADVDTPALLLDLDAFERNLATMADAARALGVRLRPHAKSHKCAEIARRQVAAGAVGVCVQKTAEAEALVDGGIGDVLIANEVVGRAKLARVAALAKRARIGICVDDASALAALDDAARAAGARIDVFVELNVGANRCGVAPGEPALRLARIVHAAPHLRLAGLQAYHGAAQHVRAVEARRAAIDAAVAGARGTRELLTAAGLPCEVVTGAGTGSFPFEGASGVYDELQPGSYVFMDADYARNAWEGFPRFGQSLFLWSTVMSAPAPGRVVVDVGLKAHAFDSGNPLVVGWPGVEYARASDEHGVLEVAAGAAAPRLGDRLRLVPGHCDPTVNLHDWIVAVRGERVEEVWPVSARGAFY